MQQSSYDSLVSEIYAASGSPARWGNLLDRCMALVGAQSGWVNELDRRDRSRGGGMVRNLADETQQRYFAHFSRLDPFRVDEPAGAIPLGLLTDEDFIDRDELLRGEFYADFLHPLKVRSILILRLFDDGVVTRSMHLNFEDARGRRDSRGWRDLQRVLPHMQRAASLGRELRRHAALSAALGQVADAAGGTLLLDGAGRIVHASRRAEGWLRRGECLVERGGRLRTASAVGAGEFDRLVADAAARRGGPHRGGAMRLPARGRDGLVVVTVTPIDAASAGDPTAYVTWRDPGSKPQPCCREAAERFGLTAAETRVAQLLLAGLTPRQAATRLDVSYHTVRNHLKQVFGKVGVNRQAELVATFGRLQP